MRILLTLTCLFLILSAVLCKLTREQRIKYGFERNYTRERLEDSCEYLNQEDDFEEKCAQNKPRCILMPVERDEQWTWIARGKPKNSDGTKACLNRKDLSTKFACWASKKEDCKRLVTCDWVGHINRDTLKINFMCQKSYQPLNWQKEKDEES